MHAPAILQAEWTDFAVTGDIQIMDDGDVQALQYEADDAEQEAQQALQMAEQHLMNLACTVQQFQEQIAHVLPDVSRKRGHAQM